MYMTYYIIIYHYIYDLMYYWLTLHRDQIKCIAISSVHLCVTKTQKLETFGVLSRCSCFEVNLVDIIVRADALIQKLFSSSAYSFNI